MKTAKEGCIVIALLILLIVPFYSNRIFLTGVNPNEDLLERDIPHASFFVNTLKKGALPLWNPYKICGLPFFEDSFMGPYYPFALLYLFLPVEKAINFGFLIHILLSGVFMYILSKELRLTALTSFFCASSWMLSSIFQQYSESGWLGDTVAVAYLPLLIYFFIKATRPDNYQKLISALLGGLALALTITGGYPCLALICAYSLLIFALPSLRHKENVWPLLIILLTGALVSIVSWGPVLIQAAKSKDLVRLVIGGYKITAPANFLYPTRIRVGFAGRLILVLACIGVFRKKTPYRINFIPLLFFSFLFMFTREGSKSMGLLNMLPLAGQMHYLGAWNTGFIFSLIIFAGVGLDKLSQWLVGRKKALLIIVYIFIALQLADLYHFNRKFYPRGFQLKLEEYFLSHPFFDFLKADHSLFRISNMLYKHPHLRINQGMVEEIGCFQSRIRGVNSCRITGRNRLSFSLGRCPGPEVAEICNIKYRINDRELSSEKFTLCLSAENPKGLGKIYLYRDNFSFPRAFLLEGASRGAVKIALLDNYTAPLCKLKISEPARNILSDYKEAEASWSPNTYTVSLECKSDSFLFLSEMFDSGWKASLNGSAVKIYTPFNFFMGVFLPPGKHIVTFRFQPVSFYIFSLISIVSLLASIFTAAYPGLKKNLFKNKKMT